MRRRGDHEYLKGCTSLVPTAGNLDDVRVCADDLIIGDEIQQHIVHHLAQRKGNGLFTNGVLQAIGDAHGKSVAQVVLRWMIQRQVFVIPKTVNPDRMAQNIDVLDFTLTDDDMARIGELHTGRSQFFDHADPDMVRWLSARRLG